MNIISKIDFDKLKFLLLKKSDEENEEGISQETFKSIIRGHAVHDLGWDVEDVESLIEQSNEKTLTRIGMAIILKPE